MATVRTAKQWKNKIKKAAKTAGTYQTCFDPVIDTLAGILARRDEAQRMFEEGGGEVLVKYTNKAGAENVVQNPALRLVNDLDRDALSYWRDLGLTPAGLKRIDEDAMKPKKVSPLAEALKSMEV